MASNNTPTNKKDNGNSERKLREVSELLSESRFSNELLKFENKFDNKIAELKAELKQEMANIKESLNEKITELKTGLKSESIKTWLILLLQCGMCYAIWHLLTKQ